MRILFGLSLLAIVAGCNGDGVTMAEDLSATVHDLSMVALPDLRQPIVDLTVPPDLSSPPPADLTVLPDLTALPDLAVSANDCDAVAKAVQSYIDTHAACMADADCTMQITRCGLPGVCGAYITATAAAGLEALSKRWDALGCKGPCPPCLAPRPAICQAGHCTSM